MSTLVDSEQFIPLYLEFFVGYIPQLMTKLFYRHSTEWRFFLPFISPNYRLNLKKRSNSERTVNSLTTLNSIGD